MPIPTRETLKAYFQTNDIPTQSQFAALIDAMYDMAQEATDTADAAETTADSALALLSGVQAAKVIVSVSKSGSVWTVKKQFGCTVAFVGDVMTVTYTAAFADTNYALLYSRSSANSSTHPTPTRNLGSFVVTLTGLNPEVYDFALFA